MCALIDRGEFDSEVERTIVAFIPGQTAPLHHRLEHSTVEIAHVGLQISLWKCLYTVHTHSHAKVKVVALWKINSIPRKIIDAPYNADMVTGADREKEKERKREKERERERERERKRKERDDSRRPPSLSVSSKLLMMCGRLRMEGFRRGKKVKTRRLRGFIFASPPMKRDRKPPL